jgi:hypothetical protein
MDEVFGWRNQWMLKDEKLDVPENCPQKLNDDSLTLPVIIF